MTFFIRAYLRASTDEQDANRARELLNNFIEPKNLKICSYYVENKSGAKLDRPQLFKLLEDCSPDDVLLVEDVDRLSRLNANDWELLKTKLSEKQIRIVAVNVPTTWIHLSNELLEFDSRMFLAINNMLLDMLAAIARRDYDVRRQRQSQGILKAKASGKYVGRKVNTDRYAAIKKLLKANMSWTEIQKSLKCSRNTISKAKLSQQIEELAPLAIDAQNGNP